MRPSPEWAIILGRPRYDAGHRVGGFIIHFPLFGHYHPPRNPFFSFVELLHLHYPSIPMENKLIFHRTFHYSTA
jgi:hypothetical protein